MDNRLTEATIALICAVFIVGCSDDPNGNSEQLATEKTTENNAVILKDESSAELLFIERNRSKDDDWWMDDSKVRGFASEARDGTFQISYGLVNSLEVEVYAFSLDKRDANGDPERVDAIECVRQNIENRVNAKRDCIFEETSRGVGNLKISGFSGLGVISQASIQEFPHSIPSQYSWVF